MKQITLLVLLALPAAAFAAPAPPPPDDVLEGWVYVDHHGWWVSKYPLAVKPIRTAEMEDGRTVTVYAPFHADFLWTNGHGDELPLFGRVRLEGRWCVWKGSCVTPFAVHTVTRLEDK